MHRREGFTKRGAVTLAISAIIALGLGGYGYFQHNQLAGMIIGSSGSAGTTSGSTVASSGSHDPASTLATSGNSKDGDSDTDPGTASTSDPQGNSGANASSSANSTASNTGSSSSSSAQNSSSGSSSQKLGPKLANTPYVRAAYQIYPGPMNDRTKRALAGFMVKFDQNNGKVNLTVTINGRSGSPITRTYDANDKVYFIETDFGDDSGYSGEFNFGDDGLVATTPDGYVIQSQ